MKMLKRVQMSVVLRVDIMLDVPLLLKRMFSKNIKKENLETVKYFDEWSFK